MNNIKQIYEFDESLIFKLPGSGDNLDSCGRYQWIGHLSDKEIHGKRIKSSCHRRECPICYPDWVKRESLAAFDRLSHYSENTGRKIVHYVVSPPQSKLYNSISLYKSLRQEAYQISKLRGIKGGVMIFHERAERYDDEKKYTLSHCSNGPHFHILGDGWLSNVKEFFLGDGWVVKNLRIRSKGSEIKTLFYILEHSAIGYPAISHSTDSDIADPKPRINAVTWFGTMSYNKLKIEKYTGSNTIYCPICKEEIEKSEWYNLTWCSPDDPPDEDHFLTQADGKTFILTSSVTGWYGF